MVGHLTEVNMFQTFLEAARAILKQIYYHMFALLRSQTVEKVYETRKRKRFMGFMGKQEFGA